MPPEGPDGMAYTRVEPTAQYRPVKEQHAYKVRPHMPPTHAQLFPDGSLPEHEGMTIFRRSILDTSRYNIEFWQRSWTHRGNSLVLIQLRKSKVGSQLSYGHMRFKNSNMRSRFCDEWVRKSLKSLVDTTLVQDSVEVTRNELDTYMAKFKAVPENQGKTTAEILDMSIWNNITIPKPKGHQKRKLRLLVNRKGFLTLDCHTLQKKIDMILLESYYIGYFVNGKPHGYGVQKLALIDELYYGYWKNGLKHGWGRKFWKLKVYIGGWKNG
jgi:hypothetical protein